MLWSGFWGSSLWGADPLAAPHTLEDTLRIHDVSVWEWLKQLRVDYGVISGVTRNDHPILCTYSTPARAFSEVLDLLVGLNWIEGSTAEEMREKSEDNFSVLPLPFATIYRGDPTLDPELAGVPKTFRKDFFNCETGKWEQHPWPGHYRTPYTVTLWSLKKYTDVFMREFVYGQIGKLGALENEVFLTVRHIDPWGDMIQPLRFDGSSDVSELEGDDPRFMRVEFSFSLRTWMLREPDTDEGRFPEGSAVDPVERVAREWAFLDSENGVHFRRLPNGEVVQETGRVDIYSMNLFVRINAHSNDEPPVTGNAVSGPGTLFSDGKVRGNALDIEVEDQGDTALIGEWPALLDADSLSLYGISFEYLASDSVELEISQRDAVADTLSSADSLILPKATSWEKVHYFTVVNKDSMRANIAGIPNQPLQEVHLSFLDIRSISDLTKTNPTSSVIVGPDTVHTWTGLANVPHFVIMTVTATSGGLNILTVEDDAADPAFTAQREIDSSVNVGAVFLIQPKNDSLVLRIPLTTTAGLVYIQEAKVPYNGHTVG